MKPNLAKIIGGGLSTCFNLLNDTQRLFDEFDTEAFTKSVVQRKNDLLIQGNEWLNRMNDFLKEVKDTVTAFTVTVPFEEGKDTINLSVKGNVLTIVTEFKTKTTSRKSVNTVTLPADCDPKRMTNKVNPDKHTVTIIIPKKDSDKVIDEKLQKKLEEARAKAKQTVKVIKNTFNEAVAEGKKLVEDSISEVQEGQAAIRTSKSAPKKQPTAKPSTKGTGKTAPKAVSKAKKPETKSSKKTTKRAK